MIPFTRIVLESQRRLAMPIAVYPGIQLTGASVDMVLRDPGAQFDAAAALLERYQTPCVLSAMDLSVEAEAFGCALHWASGEIPSVTGRLVTSLREAKMLAIPAPGTGRTGVYLETVSRLRARYHPKLVLAGCIGPFSLAARLVGVSEALELTLADPDLMEAVLEKSSAFLDRYIRAFAAAGANGIIMAEPAAGLLSPRGMSRFSSSWIRNLGTTLEPDRFAIVLHNCAAKALHLPAILESGLRSFHFGALMDLPQALRQISPETIICGNLDPTSVFLKMSPLELSARTCDLLKATRDYRNFVASSGCDLPAGVPLANLDAFFEAVGRES